MLDKGSDVGAPLSIKSFHSTVGDALKSPSSNLGKKPRWSSFIRSIKTSNKYKLPQNYINKDIMTHGPKEFDLCTVKCIT